MPSTKKDIQSLVNNLLLLSSAQKDHYTSLIPSLSESELYQLKSILDIEGLLMKETLSKSLEKPANQKLYKEFMGFLKHETKKAFESKENIEKDEEAENLLELLETIT